MIITLNHKTETIQNKDTISVKELLELKKVELTVAVVKINGNIVLKENFSNTMIKEEDDIVILNLVSGG